MLSRVRLMLLALLAVFAFGAVATAAAQAEEAPFWSVGGARLEEGKTHYITAKVYNVTGAARGFTLSNAGKSLHCESLKLKEGVILGSKAGNPGTNDEVIEFVNCTVTGNGSPCKPVEPIVTNNLKSELVETEKGDAGSLLTEFKPEKGTKIATIKLEGSGCIIKECTLEGEVAARVFTDPNNGELGELVKLPNGNKEAKSWLLNFPSTPIKEVWLIKEGAGAQVKLKELLYLTESATLEGTALVLLAKKNSMGEYESEEVNWSPLP